jgi:shikimate dehydrogenase
MMIGAGGAARAVAFELAKEGAKSLLIVNRALSRAKALVRDIGKKFTKVDWMAKALSSRIWPMIFRDPMLSRLDVIINATSVGMNPKDPSVIPGSFLNERHVVCDLIYRVPKTRFLSEAEAVGAKTVNGMGMLLHQGALAFELCTGKKPPIELMKGAVESYARPD